jgi:hypothetical protein
MAQVGNQNIPDLQFLSTYTNMGWAVRLFVRVPRPALVGAIQPGRIRQQGH